MQAIKSAASVVYFQDESYTALHTFLEQRKEATGVLKLFILVDTNTHEHCLSLFLQQLQGEYTIEIIEIPAGEENKHIQTCSGIWESLADLGADRHSILINLGGGVVTDIGGFIACTYKRGITYINVPTTLLAMVDASVGGKTGVDLGNLKNMVGVIGESEMVLVDTSYLATLPQNEMRSGLAEMLKHGLIQDAPYWKQLQVLSNLSVADLPSLIHHSVGVKNKVVLQDPTEKNIRKFLNFGHTLGHAIESYYLTHPVYERLLHGEAIAIGMIMEGYISHKLFDLSAQELQEISKVFMDVYPHVPIQDQDINPIIELLAHDKKNKNGVVLFCLLERIGQAVYDCQVSTELIQEAIAYYNNLA